jgi:flagella basal body P-ring formation protein FlgA
MVESGSMHPDTMRTFIRSFFACAALLATLAWGNQDPAPVRKAVEDYLHVQTKGLPGEVSFTVGAFNPNNGLPPCASFEVGREPGARLWGRTNVMVRCTQEGGWRVFVPVHIRVFADYLVTGHPLVQGQPVSDADLATQRGDLADLPAGILTDARQAVGRTAAISVPAGRPLRADMLRQAVVVQQGQNVKLVSRGPGFEVANEGRALNNAADGQVAQVRLANGQVVSGIARPGGVVEVGL